MTILPGVDFGDFAAIGARTIVKRDIPKWCVAVGVALRAIKKVQVSRIWQQVLVSGVKAPCARQGKGQGWMLYRFQEGTN